MPDTRKLTNWDNEQSKMKRFINAVLLCYMKGKDNLFIYLFSQTRKPWSLHYLMWRELFSAILLSH